jgi:hypothetical protein
MSELPYTAMPPPEDDLKETAMYPSTSVAPSGQYNPTYSQPPGHQYGDSPGTPTGSGMGFNISFGTLKIVQLVLRVVIWFFAMICFSATADVNGYDSFDSFNFMVAIGVLIWLTQPAIAAFMVAVLYMNITALPAALGCMIAIGSDLLFAFLGFCAFIAQVAAIHKDRGYETTRYVVSYSIADTHGHELNNLNASAAFMFFTVPTLVVAAAATFKLRQALEQQPGNDSDPAPYQDAAALDYSIEQL